MATLDTSLSAVINRKSDKHFTAVLLLCFFLGFFGLHRFYVGRPITGTIQLTSLGGLGLWAHADLGVIQFAILGGLALWALTDLIVIVIENFRDKEGRTVRY